MQQKNTSLDNYFYPTSIAVFGVTEAPNSFGARLIRALKAFGFTGKIFAINNSGDQIMEYKIHRSVLEIPDPIDLAVICIPARFCPAAVEDCLKKGIKSALVLSAGFAEFGEEGRKLEQELTRISKKGIRIIGPNCFGIYCPSGHMTMVPGGGFPQESGGVGLIAQSGTFSEVIIVCSVGQGIRFSKAISYGNACDVNESDLLDYMMNDDQTRIFMSYTEGVQDGRRFFDIARRNSHKKPIIIWKVGLTRVGGAAAASHTGSLAGGTTAWDTFFRQTHAIKVNNQDELIDTAIGFSCIPSGCGKRVALISGGGGGTVVGADAAELAGLEIPPFPEDTMTKLKALIPAVGTAIRNPLDTGNPHPSLKMFREVLETIAASDATDVIVIRRIFFSLKVSNMFGGTAAPPMEQQQEMLDIPVEVKNKYGKPILIILDNDLTALEYLDMEGDRRKIRDYFFAHGIPTFLNEDRTFGVISRLARFKEHSEIPFKPEVSKSVAENYLAGVFKTTKTPVLDEVQCKDLLKKAGIKIVDTMLATTKKEAVDIANKLGFPLAMKVVSPEVTHKTEAGGVKLGIINSKQAGEAFDEILRTVKQKVPNAVIGGVSVQKMARPGLELVIGMTRDPQFGPMIMFGAGGIFVEVMKDVAFRFVPLTREDARELIRDIKSFPLLQGFRGQPVVDLSHLEDLLLKVSRFIENNPEIKEMDINPLVANSDGITAVDARIILDNPPSMPK
jgi:acetate---CoA ligase (ADP-forming)